MDRSSFQFQRIALLGTLNQFRQILVIAILDAGLAPMVIDMQIVHDGEQPWPQSRGSTSRNAICRGARSGVSCTKSSARSSCPRQRACVATQTGNLGNDGVTAIHALDDDQGVATCQMPLKPWRSGRPASGPWPRNEQLALVCHCLVPSSRKMML